MTPNRKNLSDSRGNALGIGIFLFFLQMLGVNRTCELGMTRATGHPYRHLLEVLEEATRPLA